MTGHFLQCVQGDRLWSYDPHLICIIQQAGGPPAPLNGGTCSSCLGLKRSPQRPATGGPRAQWENEDLCAPLNPQEFLIKQGGPGLPRALSRPPGRGLPPRQREWSSSALCTGCRLLGCCSPSPFWAAQELSPSRAFKALRTSSSFHSLYTCVCVWHS